MRRTRALVSFALLALAVGLYGCASGSASPESLSPTASAVTGTDAQGVAFADRWVGVANVGEDTPDGAQWVPFVYSPDSGEVQAAYGAWSKVWPEVDGRVGVALSTDRQWMIMQADETSVMVGKLPELYPTRSINYADIPVSKPGLHGAPVGFVPDAPATLLLTFSDIGPANNSTYAQGDASKWENWSVDLSSDSSTPVFVSDVDPKTEPPFANWSSSLRGGDEVAGNIVTRPDGSQLRLEAIMGDSSVTLRTWSRATENDEWAAFGQAGSLTQSSVRRVDVLAAPSSLH